MKKFYDFMIARESLRLKKAKGDPFPWSDDEILNTYKFTNVKREHDRTTKWMRRYWTDPNNGRPSAEILFNCALFRYFGTAEFAEAIGWQTSWEPHDQAHVKDTAEYRLRHKERVFTGAYVITNQGIAAPKQEVVVDCFLTPFWKAAPKLAKMAASTRSWELAAKEMMKLQGFGGSGFMTKEILQDALHTSVFNFGCSDRNTYCPIGPGANRGLNRLAARPLKSKSKNALAEMLDLYVARKRFWPANFVELELHDIQFQLCEFDKYERVRLGQGKPRSKYRVNTR